MLESKASRRMSPAEAREHVSGIFTRESASEAVAVAHGYGIQLRVEFGHLVLRDGIGRHRRERKYAKAERKLRRIVVTGPHGYVTLEALRWCAEHGISVVTLSLAGKLVAHYGASESATDAKLLRRQALAAVDGIGTEVARELLTRKVSGQADLLLKLFSDARTADRVYHRARQMADSQSIAQNGGTASLSELEGWAGKDYFAAWCGRVSVPWDSEYLARIPANWIGYAGRSSQIIGGGKKYNATNPVNAMLNYAYTLGYMECRSACIAHGLNPALGFIHTDKSGRDSLALDVLEAIRPEIDRHVLGLLGIGAEPRRFTYRDFTEPYGYEPGTCRIVAPLTHEIAEASYEWSKSALDAAQAVVNILTGHAGKRGTAMPNWKVHRDTFTTEKITAAEVLPDSQWNKIRELVPLRKHKRVGHRPIDDRVIIAGILHCERNRRPWAHVPESLGVSYRTMRERRRQWQRMGVWPQIAEAIEELTIS